MFAWAELQETDGRDERHRRMPLRRKGETDGPSVFMSFHLGDIRVCHSSWPSPSRRRTSPRRMPPRRMPLRRMFPRRMFVRGMSPRRMVCCCSFSPLLKALVDHAVWLSLMRAMVCVCVCVCVCGVCVCVWVGVGVGVCGWSGGCVRVEERMAKRACFVVGSSFDYSFVSSLFMKILSIVMGCVVVFACFCLSFFLKF